MSDTPVAGRLRRPGWRDPRLLVGLVLIAVAVTAVSAMVRSADTTVPYYAARDTLTPGTVITEDDVVVVRARVSGGGYIAADGSGDDAGNGDAGSTEAPWGKVVTRVVGDGELLPAAALADPEDFDGRTIAVRTALPLAAGIDTGSLVDVYLTVERAGAPETRLVASDLVVESVDTEDGSFSSSSTETVYVVVPQGDLEDFLDALAADGDISVVGIAGGGK